MVNTAYSSDLKYNMGAKCFTLDEYKAQVKESLTDTDIKRIYFDNMLISGDWAAIHYRIVSESLSDHSKEAGSVMQFLHFEELDGSLKIVESWVS